MTHQAHTAATAVRRSVTVVDDAAEYARLVREIGADGSAIPVLRRALARGFDEPPAGAALALRWSGVVAVVEPARRAMGECLARATGREARDMSLADAIRHSLHEPTTVIGTASSVTPAELASVPPGARLGFLVADEPATLSAIVARNVLWAPILAGRGDVAFDMLAEEDDDQAILTGERLTPGAVRAAVGDGVRVLTGRSHGRNCLMHLNNGGICGRAEEQPALAQPPPLTDSWMPKPTACQQGPRCWREDVTVEGHLRAATIRAAVAVLDSCGTATVADSAVRTDVSLPLNMLAGRSLAAVCGVGVRAGSPDIARLFRALVRHGLPLGEAMREVNLSIDGDPYAMGALALFGDAGLSLTDRSPAGFGDPVEATGDKPISVEPGQLVLAGADELVPVKPNGPLLFPRTAGAGTWVYGRHVGGDVVAAPIRIDDLWRDRVRPWLARLRAVGGMGLTVDRQAVDAAQRAATAAVIARGGARHFEAAARAVGDFETALTALAALQERLVADEVTVASNRVYYFARTWPKPWASQTATGPEACPQCGQIAVTRHSLRSAAGASEPLLFLSCARCAEVMSGAAESPVEATVGLPPEVRAGTGFTLTVTVSNTAPHPVAVSVGAAFVHEPRKRCRMAAHSASTVAAGETVTFDFPASTEVEAIPDMKQIRVFVAADGAVRCHSRYVWLRA